MKVAQKDQRTLKNVVEKFRDTTGYDLKVEKHDFVTKDGVQVDALLRLQTPFVDCKFHAEIKTRLVLSTLGAAIFQMAKHQTKGILLTDYVNPKMAEYLKKENIAFLDEAGNAFLNEPPLFLYIKGNKPTQDLVKKPATLAFQTCGLKILFAFLNKPELVNAPYREVAKVAQVALGTVGWVMRDLRELGFVMDVRKQTRVLQDKQKLIERWAEIYPEKMRPKLVYGRYVAKDEDWWRHVELNQYCAFWGAEVAAAKLTGYLKPEIQTIYTTKNPTQFIVKNQLVHDPKGKIEILETFWNFDKDTQTDLVPPLLIYADLLATGDPRNIETARMIYDKYITQLIR